MPDSLTDRIRDVLNGGRPSAPPVSPSQASAFAPVKNDGLESDDLEGILGGRWCQFESGGCFIVEHRFEPDDCHGHDPVRKVASRLEQSAGAAPLFGGSASTPSPFVFFDLETTGLSGGAGTLAFLVGCASFDSSGAFVVRQFLLTRCVDERALLQAAFRELARAGSLVSFNGKSFDATVLETRFLFHRLSWMIDGVPHIDVVHPARQFWKNETCSLIALEREVLGIHRAGDVPGSVIPLQYFEFVRTGDARSLVAVLDHNRMDLLTLAALTARLLHLAESGPDEARNAREALALGRVYERAGMYERARKAFERAVSLNESGAVEIAAVRALALSLRRAREHHRAAAHWRRLVEIPSCPAHVTHEAMEALAIHHEHRARDFPAARIFALRSLEEVEIARIPRVREGVLHRLERIERKIQKPLQAVLFAPGLKPIGSKPRAAGPPMLRIARPQVSATQLLLSWS
ncbi:MAG TPA: ribonuclease H-like domain-containing protein [Vicinamibacterales bacterium]|nr:ribonuclease H-like domain-containing protein [Vicinamibacterales bacterium]